MNLVLWFGFSQSLEHGRQELHHQAHPFPVPQNNPVYEAFHKCRQASLLRMHLPRKSIYNFIALGEYDQDTFHPWMKLSKDK